MSGLRNMLPACHQINTSKYSFRSHCHLGNWVCQQQSFSRVELDLFSYYEQNVYFRQPFQSADENFYEYVKILFVVSQLLTQTIRIFWGLPNQPKRLPERFCLDYCSSEVDPPWVFLHYLDRQTIFRPPAHCMFQLQCATTAT